jgi:hypothetical protein
MKPPAPERVAGLGRIERRPAAGINRERAFGVPDAVKQRVC